MASIRPRKWTTKTGQPRSGWEVSWYEQKRRRKQVFSGAGAKAKAIKLRARLDSAAPAQRALVASASKPTDPTTVELAGDRWVRYVERELGREKSTWKKYEQRLDHHISPAIIGRPATGEEVRFGEIPVRELTAPDVEALKDHLLATLSSNLASKVLSVLRMMLNDVVRRGERDSNPAQTVRIRTPDRGEDEVKIPQLEEMRAILAAASMPPPAPPTLSEVWVGVTIFSGLRPSENRGLAIEDLVLDGPDPGIPVRRRADQWNVIGPVKSASGRRFISLPPSAVALLKRWLLVVPRGDGFGDPDRPGRRLHPVFPTSIGTLQSLANIFHRLWVPLLIKAELVDWVPVTNDLGQPVLDEDDRQVMRPIPRYPINSLRHFHASWLIDQGWSPKKVQKRMGHSSIQVTYDRYGHLFDRRESDASEVARLEHKLLG